MVVLPCRRCIFFAMIFANSISSQNQSILFSKRNNPLLFIIVHRSPKGLSLEMFITKRKCGARFVAYLQEGCGRT